MADFGELSRLFERMTPEEADVAGDIAKSTGRQGREELDRAKVLSDVQDAKERGLVPTKDQPPVTEDQKGMIPKDENTGVAVPEEQASDLAKYKDYIDAQGRTLPDDVALPEPKNSTSAPAADVEKAAPPLDKSFLDKYKKYIAGGAGAAGIAGLASMDTGAPPPSAPPMAAPVQPQLPPPAGPPMSAMMPPQAAPMPAPMVPPPSPMANMSNMNPTPGQAPPTGLMNVNFGNNNEDVMGKLKALQAKAQNAAAYNQIAKGANLFAASMARVPPKGQELYDENAKIAQIPLQHFLQQQQFQKQDPNSGVSQGYRQLMAKLGYNIQGSASANDLESMFPVLGHMYDAEQSRQARQFAASENAKNRAQAREESNVYKQMMMQNQQDKQLEGDRQKFGQSIDFTKQARGVAAQIEGMVQQGDRIKAIMDRIPKMPDGSPNLNKLTPAQKTLMVTSLDNLTSGKATISGHEDLMNSSNSIFNDAAKLKQYLTGAPASGNEGKLMKGLLDTIDTERGLASEKVKDMAFNNSVRFDRLNKADPDFVKKELKQAGGLSDDDLVLRQQGYRGADINRLKNYGYSQKEIVDFANNNVDPTQVQPKNAKERPRTETQTAPTPSHALAPEDVDSNMSQADAKAHLQNLGVLPPDEEAQ